jgi:hypothetical protein
MPAYTINLMLQDNAPHKHPDRMDDLRRWAQGQGGEGGATRFLIPINIPDEEGGPGHWILGVVDCEWIFIFGFAKLLD